MSRVFVCCVISITCFLFGNTISSAQTFVFDAAGFETPDYVTGGLVGQQSWSQTALSAPMGGTTSAAVQSTVALDGQAVELNYQFEDRTFYPFQSFYPNVRSVLIEWSINVPQVSGDAFGPLFGMDVYANALFGDRIATVGMDASTGELLYVNPATSAIEVLSPLVLDFDVWHTFSLLIDYASTSSELVVNGSSVATIPGFITPGVVSFRDASLVALLADDPAFAPTSAAAYFDNYVVTVTVPTPAAGVLLVCSLPILCRARRR